MGKKNRILIYVGVRKEKDMTDTKETFYTAKNDNVFKSIFCDEKNTFLLKTLMERCLNTEIKIIKIYSPKIKENIYAKGQILDLLIKADNKLINVEVNSGFYEGMHIRNFSYISGKYNEDVKIGESYLDMNDVMQINFTWGLPARYPILGKYTTNDDETGIKFVDNFKIYEYNIDKIKDLWYSGDKKYEFLAILDCNKEELDKIESGDPYMEGFKKRINTLNDNKEYKEFLSAEEDMKKTNNTFKEIGRREGIKEEKREIAMNLLNKKMKISDIAEVTGLSIEEIKNLK